jgi:aminoglycoside phosphotransferase (APT) family kinase protein
MTVPSHSLGKEHVDWLPEPTPAAVADALATVAPQLAGLPVTIPDVSGQDDPRFHTSSAALGDEFIVKFAWSKPAASRVRHQITVLDLLARDPAVPYLPEVIAAGTDPPLLVTRRVRGTSLFAVADSIDRGRAGEQIARFLAALHGDGPRRRFEAAVGPVAAWYPLVSTDALREGFGRLVTPTEQRAVERWCDWTDGVLAAPGRTVLVHGDFHGDNQVWSAGDARDARDARELQAVIDFENVGLGEPEYELRAFPGPGLGPDLELLTAVMRCYEGRAGRALSAERILAWHVRQALGDVLWRSEAGLPAPDGRPPRAWVADIALRLSGLGITV